MFTAAKPKLCVKIRFHARSVPSPIDTSMLGPMLDITRGWQSFVHESTTQDIARYALGVSMYPQGTLLAR